MQSEIEALPEPLAQEVLDFILFVKGRRAGAKAVAAGRWCAIIAVVTHFWPPPAGERGRSVRQGRTLRIGTNQ